MNTGRTASWRGKRRIGRASVAVATLLVGLLLACVARWTPELTGHRRTEPVAGAGARIGAHACYDCHDSYEGHFVASEYHSDCESCHGPAQLHAHTARASDIRHPGNGDCASCHQTGRETLLGWTRSAHARSGVLCSDCHDTHNRSLLHVREVDAVGAMLEYAGSTTRMCSSCHPEVVSQLELPSHHPIFEGMLGCTDCHAAHESRGATLGPRTQVCADCHQEVSGPWIYEHAPVTEDCGYCHTPHGSSVDFLLEASQPAACISCHTLATSGAVHIPYAFTTGCTDCHNAVHGSDTDPHLRR